MDEHTLNDLLECSVCLERLNTSSKVLPCQHTFCRKCLEVIVASKKELRCPECRVVVNIPIDDLPPNVLLMRILEGMKNAATSKENQQNKLSNKSPIPQVETQKSENSAEPSKQNNSPDQRAEPHVSIKQNIDNKRLSLGNIPQQKRYILPHAYAIYDFNSKESINLNFKKGDLILLKRNFDKDWCLGLCNGKEGKFPIAYVKVIVPLPSPQCIALYDFKMGPNEDEGCLSFKKGVTIHVLRRVDQNWAEGRIGSSVGIFPIAFVELNHLAKQVLQVANNHVPRENQPQLKKDLQSPEINRNIAIANPQSTLHQNIELNNQNTISNRHLDNVVLSNANDAINPCSSRTSTTINSMNPSRSVDSLYTRSNSPHQTLPINENSTTEHVYTTRPYESNSVRFRETKRHSLHSLVSSPTLSLVQSNRHSAEILSVPSDLEQVSRNFNIVNKDLNNQPSCINDKNHPPSETNFIGNSQLQQRMVPKLPWGFVALYPYKPRKSDELELEKGGIYIVTEMCLDGWFKGKNKQEQSGVFPGNYVSPLRYMDQQMLTLERNTLPTNVSNPVSPSSNAKVLSKSLNYLETTNNRREGNLPELPPRATFSESPCNSSSNWCNPIGYTVDALFNRNKNHNVPQSNSSPPLQEIQDQEIKSKESSSSPSGALNLMKRLATIKSHSKSKISHNSKPDQIDFNENCNHKEMPSNIKPINMNENKHNLANTLKAVHVRSGSCPSQLLQATPTNFNENIYIHQQQQTSQQLPMACGSQRVKNKERPALIVGRKSLDGAALNSLYNTSIKPELQNILTSSQNIQNPYWTATQNTDIVAHRKSSSFDASAILNNRINNHFSESAIKASATSKSMHGTTESRFRCIVPYPPNSDVELELHVGDIVYVQRKQKNGWYKGTHARTNKTGLFPASFVEPDN